MVDKVNRLDFIDLDPISVPHRYTTLQDIEISGFFSAMLSWGNRKTIINKSLALMYLMDDAPFDFIKNHQEKDRRRFLEFKHRTFQCTDLLYFIDYLQRHYQVYDSLEAAFRKNLNQPYNQESALIDFHRTFFDHQSAPQRTVKHIATPAKKSTCKRLNMYLRWMVRKDERNVDFGVWKSIPMSELMIPLDVHVERYAREFGFLTRIQRDWKAVEEITSHLKMMDPNDPIKYDYALFGLGVSLQDF
ncbi:MAG: TIGR02757 family protein [Saprospiraceae bacterium]